MKNTYKIQKMFNEGLQVEQLPDELKKGLDSIQDLTDDFDKENDKADEIAKKIVETPEMYDLLINALPEDSATRQKHEAQQEKDLAKSEKERASLEKEAAKFLREQTKAIKNAENSAELEDIRLMVIFPKSEYFEDLGEDNPVPELLEDADDRIEKLKAKEARETEKAAEAAEAAQKQAKAEEARKEAAEKRFTPGKVTIEEMEARGVPIVNATKFEENGQIFTRSFLFKNEFFVKNVE